MDEPAIRMWAWEANRGMTVGGGQEKRLLNFEEALTYSDRLAAWVMSGRMGSEPAE